jgi:pyruvate dehydrogenase E2 component (dihydrolipoamide acetyltransferase)
VESEKVTIEIESPALGILGRILYPEDSKVRVTQVVAVIVAEGEAVSESYGKPLPSISGKAETTLPQKAPMPEKKPDHLRAAPLARKIAQVHGIDLSLVRPTGPHGAIMKKDVEAYLASMQKKAAGQKELEEARIRERAEKEFLARAVDKDFLGKEVLETIPIKGIRRAIYDNMYMSLSQTAQLTLHTEACGGALIDLRDDLNKGLGKEGIKVSYNAILVKIVATALRIHPRINASVEGNEIRVWQQIHIGVAMESEDALVVPVIRNPDLKSINEINRNLHELIIKTGENRLVPDDLGNGTFTISNLGFADIDYFTPILRPPESALLGVGRIVEKPVIKDGQIIPEARVGLSLTFDHRIIDGAPAARFLKTVKEIIEDPVPKIR